MPSSTYVFIDTSRLLKFARRIDEINQLIREGFVVVADLTYSEKQQAKFVAK
ncbi:conserved protein of unknown function [Limnospira indica PCC 8005]|uniref:Uncharacterized protein n=1 Tax=Limnospira indica PCC 8005 TaxID=376219 RepID=A0A9P1KD85_9CYAN|nr:conserved protein of unknown function [Limnospira indica PCC 8005]